MFCSKCGHKNSDISRFCAKCGNALVEDQPQQPLQQEIVSVNPSSEESMEQEILPKPQYEPQNAAKKSSTNQTMTIVIVIAALVLLLAIAVLVRSGGHPVKYLKDIATSQPKNVFKTIITGQKDIFDWTVEEWFENVTSGKITNILSKKIVGKWELRYTEDGKASTPILFDFTKDGMLHVYTIENDEYVLEFSGKYRSDSNILIFSAEESRNAAEMTIKEEDGSLYLSLDMIEGEFYGGYQQIELITKILSDTLLFDINYENSGAKDKAKLEISKTMIGDALRLEWDTEDTSNRAEIKKKLVNGILQFDWTYKSLRDDADNVNSKYTLELARLTDDKSKYGYIISQKRASSKERTATKSSNDNKKQAACFSNQKEIATAILMYIDEHDGTTPPADNWAQKIGVSGKVLICPSGGNGYAYNDNIASCDTFSIENVKQVALTADSDKKNNLMTTPSDIELRHNDKAVISFLDGHVVLLDRPKTLKASFTTYDYDSDYILYESNRKYLTHADIMHLSYSELRLARNEIYARHGYIFTSADLKSYFNNKSWYKGRIKAVNFKESSLNVYERRNVELIKRVENDYGG